VLNDAVALIERSCGRVEFRVQCDAYPYVFTACAMAGAFLEIRSDHHWRYFYRGV